MAQLIFKCRYLKSGGGAARYAQYVATRDGVEKYLSYIDGRPQSHGLFSDSDEAISLNKVARELAAHEGAVYLPIISLRREDAARLGYDNAASWRNLLCSHAQTFAEQFKILPSDLRWYAAFHDEGHHPHAHMIVYSAGKEGYLTKRGIEGVKSALARDIFKQDLMQVYEQQTTHRDDLRQAAKELVGQHGNPVVENLLRQLAEQLREHKGRNVYAYLSPDAKATVNRVVDELAKDERIAALYDLWYEQREAVLSTYSSELPERISLSENDVFRAIKNAVVAEAVKLQLEQSNAAGTEQSQQSNAGALALGSFRLLGQLSRIIENKIDDGPGPVAVDGKLLAEVRAKKQDQGLKF